ncbi:MAG: hypothetical protein PHI12_08425 [Dehalococcoidales bacterium]|nr:hypothetical protein [Dehalococcoidales bacterium]
MVTKSKVTEVKGDKPKAAKYDVTQLVITAAYAKTFSSGKGGFFGKAINPATGKKYQIVGAVEIAG